MSAYTEKLLEKLRESIAAVLPIVGIVLVQCLTLVRVPSGILLCFLSGAVLLTVGMMFFNLGAEMAMSPIGERVGPAMTKSRKLGVVLLLAFLLVAITNQGYTEMVMDAARKVHAAGGTIIHAKGTGTDKAEKFLGVSLVAEKEMVLIVARQEKKNEIMRSIMDHAGLQTKARAVVFSLPVTDIAGMYLMNEMLEEA